MGLVARLTDRLTPRGTGRALPVPPVGFTDGTIALRPWRPSDGLDLAALCDDPEIHRFTSVPADYPARDAAGNAAFAEEQRLAGRGVHLAITDAHDAVLLGAIDLTVPGPGREVGRVSFLLAASARGAGHATRAVRLLDGWASGGVGVVTLQLRPQADNDAAIAVAGRTGFTGGGEADADGRLTFTRRAGGPLPPGPAAG